MRHRRDERLLIQLVPGPEGMIILISDWKSVSCRTFVLDHPVFNFGETGH